MKEMEAAAPDEQARFEQWAESLGLIHRSHGVISVNGDYDLAWRAWKAGQSDGIQAATKYLSARGRAGAAEQLKRMKAEMQD